MSRRYFATWILSGWLSGCAMTGATTNAAEPGPATLSEIETAIDAGRYAEAIPGLETLAARNPQDPRVQYYLGLCLSHRGDLEAAEARYRTALALDDELAEAHSNLGLVLLEQGKPDEAAQILTAYTKLRPDDGSGFYNLGLALEAKGALDAAASIYEKAAALDPKDPLPCRALGDVARTRGQIDEALEHYRRALSRSPGNPELLLVLADGLVAAGRVPEAVDVLLTLERNDSATAQTLATAAVLLSGAGKGEDARVLLEACTARFGDYPSGFFLLGTSHARAGHWREAILQFERFLELEPNGAKADVARQHLAACRARASSSE